MPNTAAVKAKKAELIQQFATHATDTASVEVQVALLTHRIKHLTAHMGVNKKDFATRRGLLKLVSQRRSLLDYVAARNNTRYRLIIERLGLRK